MTKEIIAQRDENVAQRDENVKNISIYRNSYDTTGTQCSLSAIAQRIRTGKRGLQAKTKKARSLLTSYPTDYKKFKELQFPAPTFAGIFPPNLRQAAHLAHHSGYIVLDFDHIKDIADLLAHLAQRPDIILAFVSPSGTGIKLVVHVSPTPQDATEHKAAYQATRDFLNIVLTTAEKDNVLVIGPKRLQDTTIDPLLAQINAHKNITLDTHTGAQGKNQYQDRDAVFVFCFEPQPDLIQAEASRIYRHNHDLSFERETTDVKVDGVTLTDVMRYTDPRVQNIHNLHCEKAHMQAILRLRQALNENKTAILFSAEPVSQMPVTPIKFRKEQLLAFQEKDDWQLSELQGYLEAEANRTPTEIMENEGVSIRTAYYKSETSRKQTKAEKKARAKALDEQGISVEKICAELNIKSKQTFYNWKANIFE